jgi:hypothetical protein
MRIRSCEGRILARGANGMPLECKSVTTRTRDLGLEDMIGGGVTGGPMARWRRTGPPPMRKADPRSRRVSLRGRAEKDNGRRRP